jgi:hypothetical protein
MPCKSSLWEKVKKELLRMASAPDRPQIFDDPEKLGRAVRALYEATHMEFETHPRKRKRK